MKPLKNCANGCDVPPSPPSKVICRECIDKITAKLEEWAADCNWERKIYQIPSPGDGDGTITCSNRRRRS